MSERLPRAIARAILVMLVIAAPHLMLVPHGLDIAEPTLIATFFCGALVFAEYVSRQPAFVEFREAPPFNRVRFLALAVTVVACALVVQGRQGGTELARLVEAIGLVVGRALDFPYSPVRLLTLLLPADAPREHLMLLRSLAGLALLLNLLTLALFTVYARAGDWPARLGRINLWVNMPTMDIDDERAFMRDLQAGARLSAALGLMLPFLMPPMLWLTRSLFVGEGMLSGPALVWAVALWAFLPFSLLHKSLALGWLAEAIEAGRLRIEGLSFTNREQAIANDPAGPR